MGRGGVRNDGGKRGNLGGVNCESRKMTEGDRKGERRVNPDRAKRSQKAREHKTLRRSEKWEGSLGGRGEVVGGGKVARGPTTAERDLSPKQKGKIYPAVYFSC